MMVASMFLVKSKEINNMQGEFFNKNVTEQIRSEIDYKLSIAFKLLDQISMDENVLKYVTGSNEDYYNITKIYNNLQNNLLAFSELGFTIALAKDGDNLVITPEGTRSYSDFEEKISLEKDFISKINKNNKFLGAENGYYIVPEKSTSNKDRDSLINIIRRVKYYGDNEVYFFITFYKDNLIPNEIKDSKANILINYGEQYITNKSNVDDKVINGILKQDKNILKTYSIYESNSKVLKNWKYIYFMNNKYLESNLGNMAIKVVVVNLILIIFGIVVAFLAAKKSYRPIEDILKIFNVNEEIEDEIFFINKTVNNFKEINKDLNDKLIKSRSPLKNNFLRGLLYGFLSDNQIETSIKEFNLEYLFNGVSVVILELNGLNIYEQNISRDKILDLRMNVIDLCQSKNNTLKFEFIALDYKKYALIFSEKNEMELKKYLDDFILDIEKQLNLEVTAFIGSKVENILEISNSFERAYELLDYKYSSEKENIITINNVGTYNELNYFYSLDIEKCIINYAINDEIDKIIELLEQILDENLMQRDLLEKDILGFKHDIEVTIKKILNAKDKTIKDFYDKNKDIYINFHNSIDSNLKNVIIEEFKELCRYISSNDVQYNNSLIGNIVMYIHKNFNKDVSLTDISENFNLSEAYISRLFKNSLNINFKDYLNRYRVKKAKEFLQDNNMKVNEVYKMVGCNNINTFIRIFKKYEGISPGEYTKNNSAK